MFISKKRWNDLERRVRELENGRTCIQTAEHGAHSLAWYIRMLCHFTKTDASKILASWGD